MQVQPSGSNIRNWFEYWLIHCPEGLLARHLSAAPAKCMSLNLFTQSSALHRWRGR